VSGIGHNGGPSLEPGFRGRRMAWGRARAALLGNSMPLEVVRRRVARARELGLDYTTYASIRAASGHDVLAFLFSGNALALTPRRLRIEGAEAARLAGLSGAAGRLAAVYAPAAPGAVLDANPGLLDHAAPAPGFDAGWSATRGRLLEALRQGNLPADRVVLVSATAVEREWCAAAKLGGLVEAERFFAP
jgi:hypothetical protein